MKTRWKQGLAAALVSALLLSMPGGMELASAAADASWKLYAAANTISYTPEGANYTLEFNDGTITGSQFTADFDGTLVLPESIDGQAVTAIGQDAFYNKDNLYSITIPTSITSVGQSAFSSCDNLSVVTGGAGLLTIGSSAFENCWKLSEVPEFSQLTSLGGYAFKNTALTSFVVPAGVTIIYAETFRSISELTTVTFKGDVTEIQGYAFAEVDTRILKVDGDEPLVDVGYQISKKQKVFIRRLVVEGNVKTRDNVILREMRLGDGDMYDGAKLRRSTERLNRLRYFSAVDTELVPTGKDDEVDLKVKVNETNTGALMGGIGYSTYYDVGVSASIMERNLFGRGYWLQLQGFFSWRRTSGILSFTNPRVYDTDLSIGNDLYYVRDYWDDFTKETMGDTINFSYPVGEYTSVGIGYRLERYYLSDVGDDASPYITDYKGYNWTSAINARILRDTTDARDRPTKGTIARLWAEYGGGGLGGTDNFIKAVADWQGFWSFNPENTIHLRARVGGVFQNTDKRVPVFERFWVGGMETIRGFSYSDLSPRDKNYGGDQIGGDRMGVVNLEYVWTFQKDMGLALVPFIDAGFNIDSKTQANDLYDKIVYSAGLELRWRSPMGDLRIAYGIPLSKDYDNEREPGRLEFSMGQFF